MLSWGWNQNYQLGHEDNGPRSVPQEVIGLRERNITNVVCGSRFTLALTDHGNVYSWGRGADGQLGTEQFTLGVTPKLIQNLAEKKIVGITTRGSHALAVTIDGEVFSWGRGDDGQLGLGNRKSQSSPQLIDSLVQRKVFVKDAACGRAHSVLISANGDVYSMGSSDEGATGLGSDEGVVTPTLVHGVERVMTVSCGSRHTIALTEEGSVFTWGWGTYGQLGHGDRRNRDVPTQLTVPNKVENASFIYGQEDPVQQSKIVQIACGYRHSMVVIEYSATEGDPSRRELWTWGWNLYGQLGYASETNCELVPRLVEALPHEVLRVAGGGRHTLAILQRKRDSGKRLYAWGRGDDGQLGTADRMSSTPMAIRVRTAGENIALIAGGWSHSVCVFEKNYTPKQSKYRPKVSTRFPSTPFRPMQYTEQWTWWRALRNSDLFTFGNIDGGMAQLLNTLILFLLMLQLLHFRVGFEESVIISNVLPGAAWTVFISNIAFGVYGDYMSRIRNEEGTGNSSFTAIPHGIDTILFFAFSLLIMVPEYQKTKSFEAAYDTALGCCFLLGLFELPCLALVGLFRRVIPKAALMSALAGVSLTFISMTFIVQIFENPAVGILPMMLILVSYGANVRLPLKVPAALGALLLGATVAFAMTSLGWGHLVPDENIQRSGAATSRIFYFPTPTVSSALEAVVKPNTWPYVSSVVLPMMLINLVNNIACVESAHSVGDEYNTHLVLVANALVTILGAFLGNPFPTTIYIGHPAFKAMGATTGYSYINAVGVLLLGTFDGASFLNRIVPQIAGVGLLMWIGVVVTAQAFDIEKTHAVAVALGLLPALAAWCVQNIESVIDASSKLLDPTGENPLPWNEIMQSLEDSGVRMYGLISLSRGYLLSSIFLSSTLVNIIERQFKAAAMWMLVASLLSFVGAVHSFEITKTGAVSSYGFPAQGPDEYPLQYATVYFAACIMLLCFEAKDGEQPWFEWLSRMRKEVTLGVEDTLRRDSLELNSSHNDSTTNEQSPLLDSNVAQYS